MSKGFANISAGTKSYLWQVTLITLIFSVLGITNLSIMGFGVSLRWLPLIPVALWPRMAPPMVSVIILFFLGIFQDWIGFDVPGQWALIYLLCYMVLRPFERLRTLQFGQAFLNWAVSACIAFVVLTVSGRFIYGAWPDWSSMMWSVLWSSILIPLFWMLRAFAQNWMLGHNK